MIIKLSAEIICMLKYGLLGVILFAGACMAQDAAPSPESAIPVPKQDYEEKQSAGGRHLVDDVVEGARNHWGFALSAYQAYTTDISPVAGQDQDSYISAFAARTFFNLGRRRSRFHLDLGTGYRIYNVDSSLNSWDYNGNAQYSYQFSRGTSLEISDQFTSSFNDSWSFISLSSPIQYNSDLSSEVLFNRQRITRNALRAGLNTHVGRNIRMGVFGGYHKYLYSQGNLADATAYEIGGSFDYRINRWLDITNSYSTYLNNVDARYEDTHIHRLQVGGLDLKLTRNWKVWAGGGVEFSNDNGENEVGESVNAGLGRTSERSMFSVTYQRGFTSGIGISELLLSDVVSATLGYRATRWMSTNLETYYYRNHELHGNGLLQTLSMGGGVQLAATRNIIVSVNSYYQNQKTREFSVQGLELNRLSIYAGLQFVWPSLRDRTSALQSSPGISNGQVPF
jgi:hypothetical protein